jgi:hypothetical protein
MKRKRLLPQIARINTKEREGARRREIMNSEL